MTRTFDWANRLLNSVENGSVVTGYGYDGNGNLIFIDPPDGNDAVFYSYNQRNLFTEARATMNQVVTAEYLYDGDGNRVQQVNYSGSQPITTIYYNDNLGLSQVLIADNGAAQTANLYGLDLISQDNGTQTRTLLADGLGSVRQEMAGGAIQTATTYEPYGSVLAQTGSSGTVYGFTGEQFDGAANLLYLRARYYNPGLKIFMSRDPFPGYAYRPATQHDYAYAGNNPVNRVDPTGKTFENPVIIGAGEIDYRDLTSWLYREMMHNINDPRLQAVRRANETGHDRLIIGTASIGLGCSLPGASVQVAGLFSYAAAQVQYINLVADQKPWDFKHTIKSFLGEGITLCSSTGCNNHIEYSVPGNIHFGFVSGEAGYTDLLTHAGAGFAEIIDPAHYKGDSPYTGKFEHVKTPWGNNFNLGDDSLDNKAVQFGLYLYRVYGRRLTYTQFTQELASALDIFAQKIPDPRPVRQSIADDWPYPVGYFAPIKLQ